MNTEQLEKLPSGARDSILQGLAANMGLRIRAWLRTNTVGLHEDPDGCGSSASEPRTCFCRRAADAGTSSRLRSRTHPYAPVRTRTQEDAPRLRVAMVQVAFCRSTIETACSHMACSVGGRMMRSLVVGAGAICRQHVMCLRRLPLASEIFVCDLSAATARLMVDRYELAGWSVDFGKALQEFAPSVVHVTTPPSSHYELARQALLAGCHVVVEKPAALEAQQVLDLLEIAGHRGLVLVEDYNYLFNTPLRRTLSDIAAGDFGDVVNVDVVISLDIFGSGSAYLDPAINHSFRHSAAGPIVDFLPHLASVGHAFIGEHKQVEAFWTHVPEIPVPCRLPQPGSGRDHHSHARVQRPRSTRSVRCSR